LNEPFNIDPDLWGAIQGRVVDLIRSIDDTHYIIVGGADWNSLWNMTNHLPIYPHNRLIYNFHFYEPSLLTEPGLGDQADVKNLPFPYDPLRMPSPPPGAVAWVVAAYGTYRTQGTEAYLASCLDPAATFAKQYNVPVMCSEYGCNGDNNIQEDRVRYFEAVVKLFNERNIPHASWGYKYGGFGITTMEGGDAFPGFMYHINIDICRAMGLTPPAEVTTIKTLTVSPATCSVQRGKTQQFSASGTTTSGGSTSSVIWTVNSANGSTISTAGVLSVSPGETASALTVTATSVWDADGSKAATATVTLTGAVAIETVESSPFTVSPNPTDGAVKLAFEAAGARIITVSDIAGKTLLHQTSNNQIVWLDLGNYPAGVYLLMVNDGKGQTTTKIVRK